MRIAIIIGGIVGGIIFHAIFQHLRMKKLEKQINPIITENIKLLDEIQKRLKGTTQK